MLSSAVNRARAARREESGFTLIELLIVIVILGILAGIVVFSVRGINDRGTASACKSNIKSSQVAVEAYYAQASQYPTKIVQLTESAPAAGAEAVRYKLLQEAPPAGIVTFSTDPTVEPTYKAVSSC